MSERTLVILKPDSVQRRICGEIISKIEKKGFRVSGMKMIRITKEKAAIHYAEHLDKPFYPTLEKFITSSPVIVMSVEGHEAITEVRRLVGSTNPLEAAPGTIRAEFGLVTTYNMIHASDSAASAAREVPIFFSEDELFDYSMPDNQWLLK